MSCTFDELNPEYFNRNPVVDGLLGLAVGDAFGVPVEFMSREEVRKVNLQEMVGNDYEPHFSSRWGDLIPLWFRQERWPCIGSIQMRYSGT